MVVGPREAVIFRRLPKRTRQLEEHIDRHLKRYYNGESWFEIPIVEIDKDVLKQLTEDYLLIGWKKVEFFGVNGRKIPILKFTR